eukprot:scaffold4698_cov172-Pinguiococcus_pyrenoidosus.AAC.1
MKRESGIRVPPSCRMESVTEHRALNRCFEKAVDVLNIRGGHVNEQFCGVLWHCGDSSAAFAVSENTKELYESVSHPQFGEIPVHRDDSMAFLREDLRSAYREGEERIVRQIQEVSLHVDNNMDALLRRVIEEGRGALTELGRQYKALLQATETTAFDVRAVQEAVSRLRPIGEDDAVLQLQSALSELPEMISSASEEQRKALEESVQKQLADVVQDLKVSFDVASSCISEKQELLGLVHMHTTQLLEQGHLVPWTPVLLPRKIARKLRHHFCGRPSMYRKAKRFATDATRMATDSFYLYFCCAVSGRIASTNGGRGFELRVPRAWFAQALPYLKTLRLLVS